MIALICILIMGLGSIYLFDKCLPVWILLVCVGFFIMMWSRKTFPVRGPWAPINMKERLTRDTTPPISTIKAIHEQWALNKEAKIDKPEPYRMREIAKRLIFLDGYLAAKRQGGTSQ